MIILCSDHVGFEIIKYLIDSNEHISYLVLDSSDRNNFNSKITNYYKKQFPDNQIYFEDVLNDKKFLLDIEKQQIELGILAWWPHILKGEIFNITKRGWLNFHPSFLPFNRGRNPNFWCLVDETVSGVSLHFIDEGVDTGNIVAQKKFTTTWEDTGKSVYEKSRDLIVELFKEIFPKLKNNQLDSIKQKKDTGVYHKASELDQISEIKLEENYKARDLLNILRARMFPPHPSTFFYDDGKKYSIKITIKEEQQ